MLKQNGTRDFFKKYFHGEKNEKGISLNVVVDRNLFQECASIFKINNSFAMKNDKISHFENIYHAIHLKF